MWGWSGSRPRRCLKIGADVLAWVEAGRTWRGRRWYRCAVSPVPDGAMKLSSAEPNVVDAPVMTARLRTLTGPSPALKIAGRSVLSEIPRPIVLLLPDASVRSVVLRLETVPSRADERDALVRWRLGQEQLFPLNDAKIVSQVLPAGPGDAADGQTVLAVAIQESVLAQYESLCESAGLVPQEIGLTSLRLFDLWASASIGQAWRRRDLLWLNVADQALTALVFQRGRLVFYRCKALAAQPMQKIVDECRASLEACQQRYSALDIQEAVLCAEADTAGLSKRLTEELGVTVTPIGWGTFEPRGWSAKGAHRGLSALSAMAGVA